MLDRIKRAAPYLAVLAFLAFFFVGSLFEGPHTPTHQSSTKHSDKKQTYYNPFSIWWDWTTRDSIGFYTSLLALFTGALVLISFIQIRYLIKADRLARRSLIASRQSAIAAKKAADVAKQNTDAFMSAEKGHLFIEIKQETVAKLVSAYGRWDKSESMFGDEVDTPAVAYFFSNIGKTAAS
jgi:hypothetical protein